MFRSTDGPAASSSSVSPSGSESGGLIHTMKPGQPVLPAGLTPAVLSAAAVLSSSSSSDSVAACCGGRTISDEAAASQFVVPSGRTPAKIFPAVTAGRTPAPRSSTSHGVSSEEFSLSHTRAHRATDLTGPAAQIALDVVARSVWRNVAVWVLNGQRIAEERREREDRAKAATRKDRKDAEERKEQEKRQERKEEKERKEREQERKEREQERKEREQERKERKEQEERQERKEKRQERKEERQAREVEACRQHELAVVQLQLHHNQGINLRRQDPPPPYKS